jgi:hypothetical protein
MSASAFGHRQVTKLDGSTTDAWHQYWCAHCGNNVSGAVIACVGTNQGRQIRWLQCSLCHDASVQTDSGSIYPGAKYGPQLEGLPEPVLATYEEARSCLSVNADTAAEMTCRKILMHVAVDKGADEGQSFASYIDFLQSSGYVTPPMKEWVTLIKDHGNEANHRLPAADRQRAEGTLQFTAQLLRSVYEMAHLAQRFAKPKAP